MLLVDHQERQVSHRGKHRRANPHREPDRAGAERAPVQQPLGVLQSAVQDCHRRPEPAPEPSHQLGGEGDLRDEDQRSASPGEGVLRRPQVHLGLPAPGDTLEEEGLETGGVQGPLQLRQRGGLCPGEVLGARLAETGGHRGSDVLLLHPHPSALGEALHRISRPRHRPPELVEIRPPTDRQEVAQRCRLRRGTA